MVHKSEGPFPYYSDKHAGATGDSIREAASNPAKHAGDLQALGTELEGDEKKVVGQLEGDVVNGTKANAAEVKKGAYTLAAKGLYATGLIKSFGSMVDAFDTTVSTLNQEVLTSVASSGRYAGEAAAEQGEKFDAAAYEKTATANMKSFLMPQYLKAEGKLDDDADDIAVKFAQGPKDANVKDLIRAGLLPLSAAALFPGLKLADADKVAYYKHVLAGMSPEDQVAYLKTLMHAPRVTAPGSTAPVLDPALVAAISPEAQRIIADEVAGDIKSTSVDADTVTLLNAFATQDPFASRLYTTVTPGQFGDAIKKLNDDALGSASDIDKSKVALYSQFLKGGGTALATYSSSLGSTDQSALASTWSKAITDGDDSDAAALTLMIRKGGQEATYGGHFLGDLTNQVYDWERSHDGDPVWGPKDDGIIDPDNYTTSYHSHGKDVGSYEFDSGFATDGLANLLGGMENSSDAAKIFFTSGTDHADHDKMEYLIGGDDARTWSFDDRSDDGDGLGKALQAAAVGDDTRTPEGTSVANELFKVIAEHSGEDSGLDSHLPGNNTWHVWNGMTDSLGTIAAGYSGDVYDMLSNTPPADGSTHLQVSPLELSKVLGEIGHSPDKSGLETLTTAELMEGRNRESDYLSDLEPHTLAALHSSGYHGIQETNGNVLGNLLNYGLKIADEQDQTEAARAAMISKGIDIMGGFVPGLGEGAHELTKMTYDTVKGEVLSQIESHVEGSASSTTSDYRNNAESTLPDKMFNSSLSDLYAGGYLGPQQLQTGHYDGVSPDIFTGQPPQIRPDLIDSDGYTLNDKNLSDADKTRILQAWRDFKTSDAYNLASDSSYNSNFYNTVDHPTPMEGVN